jgi:hypothetical protein
MGSELFFERDIKYYFFMENEVEEWYGLPISYVYEYM